MELACEEGRSEIFEAMLDDSSDTAWEFGPVKCVTYPLDGVDSIKGDGGLDLNSVLWRTVFGGEDGHLDILESGVIYLLLKEKWKEFAKQKLRIRFILALFYLTMLSVAVYLRPEGDLLSGTTVTDIVRYIAEVIVLIGSTIYLGFEYFNIRALKSRYWRLQIYIPAKSTFLVSCVLFLFCLPFRLLSLRSVEDILTTLAVPMAWCYLLLFYRGREELGPFVTTIYKMALGDLLPFSLIWIVIISILCSVFYYPYKDMEGIQSFDTFYGSWMYLFHMTFEDFETLISGEDDEIELSRLPVLTKILFVIFMVLIPILLMNMLIAKMAQTYQTIEHRAWRESLRQWARIIMVLEHSCSKAELQKYRKAYAVPGAKPKYLLKGTSTNQPSPSKADAEDSEYCDSLMIVKPNFRVQPQKPHGDSSIRTRLSLQNWTVVPKATRKQLIEQKRHGAKIEETTVNWIDSLPGSGL
ncbi:transient receptor potential cation channel subfamily V member 6-like [Ptychodera flava]|uniref:transient receptor potential cation channel subfamily V member 6-like n=1 Tax=Ptychodera flava TaxID=63121 RepID=UPI003969FF82